MPCQGTGGSGVGPIGILDLKPVGCEMRGESSQTCLAVGRNPLGWRRSLRPCQKAGNNARAPGVVKKLPAGAEIDAGHSTLVWALSLAFHHAMLGLDCAIVS